MTHRLMATLAMAAALAVPASGADMATATAHPCDWGREESRRNSTAAARIFSAEVASFDRNFPIFVERLAVAFAEGRPAPDRAERLVLRQMSARLLDGLGKVFPLEHAGNGAWPMKFLMEETSGGLLQVADPRAMGSDELLRAVFMNEVLAQQRAQAGPGLVGFLAPFEQTYVMLDREPESGFSQSEAGALRLLAHGHLTERYSIHFKQPIDAVVLGKGGIALASALDARLRDICMEQER